MSEEWKKESGEGESPKEAELGAEPATQAPEGADVASEGADTAPEEADTASDGADTAPDGADLASEGADIAPDGADIAPDGADIAPEGADTAPDGADIAPDGADTAPEGADIAPDAAALEAAAALDDEEARTPDEEALAQAQDGEGDEEPPAEIAEWEEDGALEKLEAKAKRLSDEQVRNIVHSLLFVAEKPLTVTRIREVTGLTPARIQTALDVLSGELREGISGVILSEVAGGWQLRTAPESAEFVRRFLQIKPRRLTRAALETLAIIAYRQPVTRPEVEDIRGVDSGAVIKALLDWKLIKILGKKDEVGRPLLYGTTREFLEFFQLKDLASLPTLREFHELTEESQAIVEEELGPEAVAGIEQTVEQLMDPSYLEAEKARIEKSENALAELEKAMAEAEEKARSVDESLAEKPTGTEGE